MNPAKHGRLSQSKGPRPEAELARLLDRIVSLRAEGLSQSAVAARLGLSVGMVAGLVGRARRGRDLRFTARSPPSRPKVVAKRTSKPRRRRLEPFAELRGPLMPTEKESLLTRATPRPLTMLRPGECRYPVAQRDGEHLFCSAAQAPGRPYCPPHAERVRAPAPSHTAKARA
jgi:hypothetical protein